MRKNLGIYLFIIIFAVVLLIVALPTFRNDTQPAIKLGVVQIDTAIKAIDKASVIQQPVVVPDDSATKKILDQRAVIYQDQMDTLDQAIQALKTDYQTQIEEINIQLAQDQHSVDNLKAQEQELLLQIEQLKSTRSKRLKIYQTKLTRSYLEYRDYHIKMQAQLNKARSALANARNELGSR